MAEMDKTNRGAIWRNEKKERDSHPDFTGKLNVDGVEYWVSAWKRKEDAPAKSPALSFSIKPKEDRAAPPARTSGETNRRVAVKDFGQNVDMQDDIPF